MIDIYEQMWQQAIPEYRLQNYFVDPYLKGKIDNRRGITLIAKLGCSVTSKVLEFLGEMSKIEPNQYYYCGSDLHLTILSIVSCRENYQASQSNRQQYLQVLNKALSESPSFAINFSGITASNAGIVLTGYTDELVLESMRENIRRAIKVSGLEHSMDSRYPIVTAHSTVMRFCETMANTSRLIEFLQINRKREFGIANIMSLELVYNDWYQSRRHSQQIGVIDLKKA